MIKINGRTGKAEVFFRLLNTNPKSIGLMLDWNLVVPNDLLERVWAANLLNDTHKNKPEEFMEYVVENWANKYNELIIYSNYTSKQINPYIKALLLLEEEFDINTIVIFKG